MWSKRFQLCRFRCNQLFSMISKGKTPPKCSSGSSSSLATFHFPAERSRFQTPASAQGVASGSRFLNPPNNTSSRLARSFSTKMPHEGAVLRYVRMTENAHPPTKGSELAAGFDLRSAYDYIIPARGAGLVQTDLQVQIPEGCYGRVAPRSGLAWKHHIDIGAGVIDADYTGNVGIIMFNHGEKDFQVTAGMRVAQLICEKICYPDIQEVKTVSETARGAGGFGSTGQN